MRATTRTPDPTGTNQFPFVQPFRFEPSAPFGTSTLGVLMNTGAASAPAWSAFGKILSSEGWSQNGAGRWINLEYGFGAIDAGAAVTLAQNFTLVSPEHTFASPVVAPNISIPDNNLAGISSTISVPANLRVERAQIILNAPHGRIGDLRIELVSPSGTASLFADTRTDFTPGYNSFTFTSVRSWDELARGTWTLRVKDLTAGAIGTLADWQLKIYGTQPACACDWNVSGSLTPQDIFDFLNDWFMSLGDFNNDAATTPQDIFDFLNCWFMGCS